METLKIKRAAQANEYHLSVLPRQARDCIIFDVLLMKGERTILCTMDQDREQAFWKAKMALCREGVTV